MSRGDELKVTVWNFRMQVSVIIACHTMEAVREKAEAMAAAQPEPFLWHTRGAVLEIRTQGPVAALLELMEWAMEAHEIAPKEIELKREWTYPLIRTRDWQGHGHG